MKKLLALAVLLFSCPIFAAERKPLFQENNAISLAFEDNRMEHQSFVDEASTQTITGFKYFDGKVELSTITVTSATVTNLSVTSGTFTNTPTISSPTYMRVYRNGALTITNGAEVQVVFDTIQDDYKGLYSTSAGSATIKITGGYTVGASVGFAAMQADVRLLGFIKVNGTNVWAGGLPAAVSTDISVPPVSWTLPLTAGDTVSIYVRHDSAAGKAIQTGLANCQFFIHRVW